MPRRPEEREESVTLGMEEVAERVRRITRENQRLFEELMAGERRFRRLARNVWNVQERERRRLARELHDGLGQTLTALKHQLERARELWSARVDESDDVLARALHLASTALEDTRELSRLLRPTMLDDLGLDAALRWLCRTFEESSDIEIERDVGLDGRLSDEMETLVFRVVQEGLTNVLKHAEARRATVRVVETASGLVIGIEDDGVGIESRLGEGAVGTGDGFGLRAMRDRLELFGGRLDVADAPCGGTRLRAVIPIEETESEASS